MLKSFLHVFTPFLFFILAACSPEQVITPQNSPSAITGSLSTTATTAPAEPISTPVTKVTLFFIAGGDKGRSGKLIGCNDSVIPVEFEIQAGEEPIKAALELLFSFKDQLVGPVQLYNALYQSNLRVDRIELDPSGEAQVWLSGEYLLGGVCDNPRFKAQIEETVLSFDQVSTVMVYINDISLDEILSGK